MDLSVIVVNYRTRERLEECLAALLRAAGPSREIFVVDNASGDGSVEMVRDLFPGLGLVANRHNYGFSIANNQGYRLSRGRYIMTLNPDGIVSEGTLKELVDFMDRTRGAGLAAPAFIDSSRNVEPTRYTLGRIERPHLFRMQRPRAPDGGGAPVPIEWIWGTGYICRRDALDSDTLFRERTFLFGEEYDLCKRLRSRGYSLHLVPRATLHHAVSASYRWQTTSLSLARRLGVAVTWDIRRREYGVLTATLSQLVALADSAILWFALTMNSWFRRDEHAVGRALGRVDYGARVAASTGLLFRGQMYLRQMNERAWRYFNDGIRPSLPPEATTHLPWSDVPPTDTSSGSQVD